MDVLCRLHVKVNWELWEHMVSLVHAYYIGESQIRDL